MAVENDNLDRIIIRNARKADLPVLVDFLAKLAVHVAGEIHHTLKKVERKRLRDLLGSALSDEDKLVIVAEDPDSGLVGMGYLYIWTGQGIWEQFGDVEFKSGIIDDIWVEPEYRKLGILRAMLRELVSFAIDRGVQELILEYSTSNKEAEATWNKLGFRPTGVRAAAYTETVRAALSESK